MPIIFKKLASSVLERDDESEGSDERRLNTGTLELKEQPQPSHAATKKGHGHTGDDNDVDSSDAAVPAPTNGTVQGSSLLTASTTSSNNGNQDEDSSSFLHNKIRYKVPRLYYITTQLILPLLTLIGMAFLFGWLLAKFEMEGEIKSNDEAAQVPALGILFHVMERTTLWETMANTSAQCFAEAIADDDDNAFRLGLSNATENIYQCSYDRGNATFPVMDPEEYLLSIKPTLTFNWMTCTSSKQQFDNATRVEVLQDALQRFGLNPEDSHDQQYIHYLDQYYQDYSERLMQLADSTGEVTFNHVLAATGSQGCKVHVAGGALFWFTIMTTIGYGNTAPATDEGKLLVYTAGFFTIICFLALNNTASKVWKYIFEDFFLSCNLKKLVKGPLSVLFWLCMTILWMLVIALSLQKYRKNRLGEDFPLKDAYWFSYITTTTVGFGDIHISHEEFTVGDMFFVPLIVLMGFNFLGIFAEKGVDLYNQYFPEESGLKEVLHDRRHKRIEQQQQQESPMSCSHLDGMQTLEEC